MAQDVLDKVLGEGCTKCNTLDIVLHGGEGYTKSLNIQLIQKYGLTPDVAEHLVKTYGGRVWELLANAKPTGKQWPRYGHKLVSNYPYIEEEVRYACREYACTIEDVLSRRTRLAFLNSEAALEALPRVAEIMAEELGWSRRVKAAQIKSAMAYIESYGGRIPVENDLSVRLPTMSDAKDIFREMDRDGTGYVKISEVKKFTHRLGQPFDYERGNAIFESMDKNRDGKINFDDFMEWFSDEETRRGIKSYFRSKTIQIFNEIDIKNHGYLDEEEIRNISIQLGQHLSDRKIKQIFVEMDTDRTGKVDIEHFIAWMDKDIDKSGFRKVLSSSMGIGGTGWLDSKQSGPGSFMG
jgi:glycerol-3-phosphate dehydrogenase